MKKFLSSILVLALLCALMPTGAVFASTEISYVSVPVSIPASDASVHSMIGFEESFTPAWSSLSSQGTFNQLLMDVNDVKNNASLSWKNEWTDSMLTNTATFDGIDYEMTVVSSASGKAGVRLDNERTKTYSVKEGKYEKISILANSRNGIGSSENKELGTGVVLNYADGSWEYKVSDSVYFAFTDSSSSGIKNIPIKTIAVSGSMWSMSTVKSDPSNSNNTAYLHQYEIPVDKTKRLSSITILGTKAQPTKNSDGSCTIATASSEIHAHTAVFAITALTTQEILDADKPYYVPVSIPASDFTKKTMADYNEEFSVSWSLMGANWQFVMDINDLKSNSNLTWKNEWTSGMTENVATFDGIEYNMFLRNSKDGGNAVDISGGTMKTYSVTEGRYTKLNILANGYTGLGYNNNTTSTKGIGVLLNYADGTQEYKISKPVYYASKDGSTADYWNGFGVDVLSISTVSGSWNGEGVVKSASSKSGSKAFINNYEIPVSSSKKLSSVTLMGGNCAVTDNGNGTFSVSTSGGTLHESMNVFAVTAETTTELYNYDKLISETIDISSLLNVRAMIGSGETFRTSYFGLSYTNDFYFYLMSLEDVKNNSALTYKEAWTDGKTSNVATYNDVDYLINAVSAKSGSSAMKVGDNATQNLVVEEGRYAQIKLLANNFHGSAYSANPKLEDLPIGIVLNYSDGTQEYKVTGPVYNAFSRSENAIAVNTYNTGNLWQDADLTAGTAHSGKYAYMQELSVAVNSSKNLSSITILGRNMNATQNADGTVSLAAGDNVHIQGNIFAVTAVTTGALQSGAEEIVDTKIVEKVDLSSYANVQSMVDFGETVKTAWAALGWTNSANFYLFDINDVKANSALKWENEWTDGLKSNTAKFGGTDYLIKVESAATGKSGYRLANETLIDVKDGRYTTIKLLANSADGAGSFNGVDRPFGIVLNYADGTQEYKISSENVGYAFRESANAISFKTIKTPTSLWNDGTDAVFEMQNGTFTGYMHVLNIEVNGNKTLTSVNLLGQNTNATQNADGTVSLTSGSAVHANTTLYAMTLLSDQTVYTEALANAKAALDEIDVSSLTYTAANADKILALEETFDICEAYEVELESEDQAKAEAVLAKWATLGAELPVLKYSFTPSKTQNAISFSATVKNVNTKAGLDGKIIVALYDASNNKLLEVKPADKDFDYGVIASYNDSFDISSYPANTTYKVGLFVWDALEGLDPYMAPEILAQ